MRQFLQTQSSRMTEYDEQMVRRPIEKLTVFDDKLIFKFKSGMSIELKRQWNKNYDMDTLQKCGVFLLLIENFKFITTFLLYYYICCVNIMLQGGAAYGYL